MKPLDICAIITSMIISNDFIYHREQIKANKIYETTTILDDSCRVREINVKLNSFIPLSITNKCEFIDKRYKCRGFMHRNFEDELNKCGIAPKLCFFNSYKFNYDKDGNIIEINLYKDEIIITCNPK
jgi:hypothetical protein